MEQANRRSSLGSDTKWHVGTSVPSDVRQVLRWQFHFLAGWFSLSLLSRAAGTPMGMCCDVSQREGEPQGWKGAG